MRPLRPLSKLIIGSKHGQSSQDTCRTWVTLEFETGEGYDRTPALAILSEALKDKCGIKKVEVLK